MTLPAALSEVDKRSRDVLLAELLRREPIILGWREGDASLVVRFRAAFPTGWVRVHVQATDADAGFDYDPDHYVRRELFECRTSRLQDVEITDLEPGWYTVFLIPVQKDAADVEIDYDGQDGREDNMAFIGGIRLGAGVELEGELAEDLRELVRESLRTNRALLLAVSKMQDGEAEEFLALADTLTSERSAT